MPQVSGKELEELIIYRAKEIEEPAGVYTQARCGTISIFKDNAWIPMNSLPDFTCCLKEYGGQEAVFDCKVCTQSSYPLSGGTHKSFQHQYKYLRKRDAFGALAFIIMHFNERKMKTTVQPELTVLLPVTNAPLWDAYDVGQQKSITRTEAALYGLPIVWDAPGRRTTQSPNIYAAIVEYNRRRGRERYNIDSK